MLAHSSIRIILTLAALALQCIATPLNAQAPNSGPSLIDPPDTEYFGGADETDPAIIRSLPIAEQHRAFLPVSVDLTSRMPPVGNQRKIGSCVAWSVGYASRSYYTGAFEQRDIQRPENLPSPNYIYHLARTSCDRGISVDRAIGVLKNGALSLADHPYTDACEAPAMPAVVARARDFRVRGVRRVDRTKLDDVKGQLARNNPVIFEFNSSPAFQRVRGADTFTEVVIPRDDKPGWHAMTLVGYDERLQAFRLMNSWGTGWGDKGFGWLGYNVWKSRVREAYVLDVVRPQIAIRPPAPRPPAPQPNVNPPPVVTTVVPRPPAPQPNVTPPPVVTTVVPRPPAPQPNVNPPPVVTTVVPRPPAPQPNVNPPPPPAPPAPVPVGPVVPRPGPFTPVNRPQLADLQKLECGRVTAQQRGGRTVLSGYVASDDDLDLVKAVVAGMPGAFGDVILAPWPQCEALETLEKQLAVSDRPVIDIGRTTELRSGDTLNIRIRAPNQISYLYVAYIQADGSVVVLAQPTGVVPQPMLPGQTLSFGTGQGTRRFTITPPFGREMIVAIASRSPLFEHELPGQQTEREYLSELRRALIYKPVPDMPDREVSASVQTLMTRAR